MNSQPEKGVGAGRQGLQKSEIISPLRSLVGAGRHFFLAANSFAKTFPFL